MQEKKQNKNKATLMAILAFLLAGGSLFIIMVMIGTKDIKNQDQRINFSYGNVIAGSVLPLFEILGITNHSTALEESTNKRLKARSSELFALSIEDWLGINNDSKPKNTDDSKSFGEKSFSVNNSYNSYGSEASDYIHKADFGMKADIGNSGASNFSHSSAKANSNGHEGKNTFSSRSAKDVFKEDSNLTEKKQLSSMKKKKTMEVLNATNKIMDSALTSGSATVARNNWSAAFGQSKELSSNTPGSNGNLNKEVFKDSNAVALDKIESGRIHSLKTSEKDVSVPTASVPAPVNQHRNGNDDEDSLGTLIAKSMGDNLNLSGIFKVSLHPLNISSILLTLSIFHLDISGKDSNA